MTDEHGAYAGLTKRGWKHQIVAHSKEEWVRGNVHTQGIENFWSLFKRGVVGSFHQASALSKTYPPVLSKSDPGIVT